jgi:protoporphyrinogen oxidase
VSVIVLGAGPAGLGAALGLAERGIEVELLERAERVGGHAGSFELAGMRVDYGSHRLHPAADPVVLARLRALLGDDLRERPRHGRIRLQGRWIHFPLRPLDLAARLPPRFAASALADALRPRRRAPDSGEESFATALERRLGPTLCREFYFPYARKIWGLEPEQISATQAQRRVSVGSLGALVRRVLSGGAGRGGASLRRHFYYPRRGYGQISERLAEAAQAAGARVSLGCRVERVRVLPEGGFEVTRRDAGGAPATSRAQRVWSTIPAAALVRLADPEAPEPVRRAAAGLELRGMLLVYLVLEQQRFSEYDAHYFPGPEVPFTRLSEPKNYAGVDEPADRTVLCAEIPCAPSDAVWSAGDDVLAARVQDGLARAGLGVRSRVLELAVRRLPAAYPIYRLGYEAHFARVDAWIESVPGLLSFGRQGLFAHDNTHHALYMAHAAVDCLSADGGFDRAAWARYRTIFARHVVED